MKQFRKMAVNGPMRKKLIDAQKNRRVHQVEEMYELLYKEKITEYLRSSVDDNSAGSEDTVADKSKRMAEWRAARHKCWENESEDVKATVKKAIAEEREEQQAQSDRYSKDSSIESKLNNEIQE